MSGLPNVDAGCSGPTRKRGEADSSSIPLSKPTQISADDAETKMASGAWLLVRAPASKPVNSEEKSLSMPALVRADGRATDVRLGPMLRARGMKPGRNGMIRVVLWQKIYNTQATTALTTVSALQPSSAQGYSSFSSEYDLARCKRIHFRTIAVEGTASDLSGYAVAFDPVQSGALTAVADVLNHQHKTGPHKIGNGASAGNPVVAVGYHSWSTPMTSVFVSGTTNDKIGGNWYEASVTSGICGYLKPHIENGSAGTVYHNTYVGYEMEFKYRG